jgi:hypothetical protein
VDAKPKPKMVCPSCGWSNLRLSMQQGLIDWILSLFLLTPYRCRSCSHRFYRFRNSWAKFVTPLLVCGLLGVLAFGGINGPTWLKNAKRSITGSLVKRQPPPNR